MIAVVGNLAVAESGEAEASRVRAAMRKQGYAAATINQTMNVFAMLLKRCYVLRLRTTPPEEIEKLRERQGATPKAYDDATFEALVAAAAKEGPECLALYLVGGETALRVGEIIGLEVRDVNLERRTVRVERSVSPTGEVTPPKNGEPRTLSMTERLAAALVPLVEGKGKGAPVFEGRDGGRSSRSGIRQRLGRVQARVGLQTSRAHPPARVLPAACLRDEGPTSAARALCPNSVAPAAHVATSYNLGSRHTRDGFDEEPAKQPGRTATSPPVAGALGDVAWFDVLVSFLA